MIDAATAARNEQEAHHLKEARARLSSEVDNDATVDPPWELDDAGKAETLLRNLARRLEKDWEGVSASILEGLDEMLTATNRAAAGTARSLACTNIIENVMGTVRCVSRNVKYWRSPSMALRWAGAAMQEAAKGFRRLKAYKQLPLLQAALAARKARATSSNAHLAQTTKAA